MERHVFPGYPKFLEAAANRVGIPSASVSARRIDAIADVANLCAQASCAAADIAPAILEQAEAIVGRLRVAGDAAELMIAHVRKSLRLDGRGEAEPLSATPTQAKKRSRGATRS